MGGSGRYLRPRSRKEADSLQPTCTDVSGDVVGDDYDASFSKMDFCFQSKQYPRLWKGNNHDSSIEWHQDNALWKLGKGRTKAAVYVGVLEGDEIVEG